jgi:hypothetical protein
MKSKILEITCPSAHKIESNITESKAAVTLRDAQPEGKRRSYFLFTDSRWQGVCAINES